MKTAFVTNICPHYRVKTFEMLSRALDVDFYFFSAGDDWYWQHEHGVQGGDFTYRYLPGVRIGGTRITPTLPGDLLRGGYDVYIKCINGRFALPITYLIARLRGKPFVLWTGIWMRLMTPFHRLFFPVVRHIYRHADAVVVYGEHVRRYLVAEGVPPERIFVAAHAVDNSAYNQPVPDTRIRRLRESLAIDPGQPVVLYLGRLVGGKGLPVLLEAFAELEDQQAVLIIAGDGALREQLRAQAAALGLDERVRFAGYVPVEETPAYYALASLFVLPSVTTPLFKEPWGLVVNEAFNQGLPVIASDAVGAAAGGLVEDEETGLIVPERDSKQLAAAIDRLLADPDLRVRMGQNARERVAAWNNARMVQGFLAAVEYVSED